MKTYTATLEKRPTKLAGLLAKFNTYRLTPAWVKIRRFFWAVGVVSLEALTALLAGVEAANKAGNKDEDDDPWQVEEAGVPYFQDPFTGEWEDKYGQPCDPP
ncbi:MAG: hypothetical protein N0E54_00560 [Candidatus Thiodiazotropha taylori]|nr:hypothetical protein [Candidatus Thiodiazotropha endolucinida]MCW4227208.1 hypothetical protein [Candidatus Thiodiazotropha taylori]